MRKSTLFISAVLTTFILVVLVGVVGASKNNGDVTQAEATAPAVAEVLPTETAMPEPTATVAVAAFLTPEQAASMAAQILGGRTDLLSVETALFNNESVYLVKFMNGDQVYISPAGMVLSVVLAPPPPPVVAASGGSSNKSNNDRPRIGGFGGGDDGGGGGGGDD